MTRHELEAVAELCRRHDLWLISDEVYATLLYEGEHVAPAGLPGHGRAHGHDLQPLQVARDDRLARRLADRPAGPGRARHQTRLVHALRLAAVHPGCRHGRALRRIWPTSTCMRERYRRRRDAVCRRLAGLPGLACTRPKGGMFVMLDVRRTGLSADAFAAGCWPRRGVACCPATHSAAPPPAMSGSA